MTTEERFRKIEAGIRDLIVVSRTVLNSIEQLGGSVDELRDSVDQLREAQKHTDEKLNALIQAQTESEHKVSRLADTVDKLVRYRGPNGQGGKATR
jgi:protein involved in polysaccharide export with SLBB domain